MNCRCIWPLRKRDQKPAVTQTAIILNCAGPEFIQVYDQFTWETEVDKNNPDKVLEKLESYWQHTDWNWSKDCEDAFKTVKKKITTAPMLAYFNAEKKLVLQVDSSQDGLGAALMQGGKPIEYASRSLTATERRWAQIEKELLSVIYGLERFDQYTFGRRVIIQNNHKPIGTILKKPLSQAPRRLQALILRLHRYDVEFEYVEGKKLVIADTVSRAYLQEPEHQVRSMSISTLGGIPDKTIQEIVEATKKDDGMQILLEVIRNGWPDRREDVPHQATPYFDLRDTLSHEDGVILKGERVVIPVSLRPEMKRRLHAAHMGYDSMMVRARETIFWPRMSSEVKQMADGCEACQQMKPKQRNEPLMRHKDGDGPWRKIGVDLFDLSGTNYLLTIDYFSGFMEVDKLSSTTACQVIDKLKGHFGRYGIPLQLVSDNAPQFSSK